MAVPVYLDFVPPNDLPDLTKLHIYESADKEGPFVEIEVVTPVGSVGDYITSYTTVLADDENDWFSIRWENSKGAFTPYSDAVQGGSRSIVADVVSRVMLRDPSLSEEIVFQEAEAIIEDIYGTTYPDPTTIKKSRLNGIAILAMARAQLASYAASMSNSGQSWTAGLVSMKTGSGTTLNNVRDLLNEASRMLGMNVSVVAQMVVPEIAGGLSEIKMADISRLLIDVE